MKQGDNAQHRALEVVLPGALPENHPDRLLAERLAAYWHDMGQDVEVKLVRMRYRPREKTESYFSVITTMVNGTPRGYRGDLKRLGAT